MTRAEVQRDFREAEGNPELKAARRRAHQEVLFSAQLAAVERARVVIVNPTHLATALCYDEAEDAAPKIVAQGQGELARQILDVARAAGVPVIRDVPVARALMDLEVGEENSRSALRGRRRNPARAHARRGRFRAFTARAFRGIPALTSCAR